MKMFLTRLGFGSKIVVTGDSTQVDLHGAKSGLRAAMDILDHIDDIHFSELTSADVVRHRLVSEIVDAYAESEARSEAPVVNRAERRSGTGRQRR
jgi:phosphate starvation-inducible PhoH-like protein